MHGLFSVSAILVLVASCSGQTVRSEPTPSLKWSCHGQPYVQVTASVPYNGAFPELELRLTDPMGRTIGFGSHKKRIPYSHYGKVVELPEHPDISKTLEAAVCRAVRGHYALEVKSHDSVHYVLSITGEDGKDGNQGQIVSLDAKAKRTYRCWFNFEAAGGKVRMQWSGENGQTVHTPQCGEPQPDSN